MTNSLESEVVALHISLRNEIIEECAKICDQPIYFQHPLKPPGVAMSEVPPAPFHANAIRALCNKV